MRAVHLLLAFTTALAGCASPNLVTSAAPAGLPVVRQPDLLTGSWEDLADPDYRIRFDGGKLIVAFGGQVRRVAKILDIAGGRMVLCEHGREEVRVVSLAGGEMVFRDPRTGEAHRLRKLMELPPDLVLQPLPLPVPRDVSAEEVATIQRELWRRLEEDQAVLRRTMPGGPAPQSQPWTRPPDPAGDWGTEGDLRLLDVVSSNTRFLRDLVSRVGWIDVGRFGYAASNAAFLLVQHSGDLPLMMAALPEIQKDVAAGRMDGEAYALLFDRLQLSLGEPQRYGSQVFRDANGEVALLPVELPEFLEERRNALEMSPIREYLKVFGGTELRISKACSGPSRK